ncbi:MAG: hypothetical protein QOG34_2063 [Frankiaceae bacterium]|jgi:uncharacterized LabA/DUF88 family protein|nr:hypothetical protein [Frankiaceae bacterium]
MHADATGKAPRDTTIARVPDRVVVFIDWQNAYNRARACFHGAGSPASCGQVDPLKLGHRLAGKRPDRELQQVRIYRGMPTPRHDAKGYAALRRQAAAWQRRTTRPGELHVTLHPLQYLPGRPPREKGVDVALAVDMVVMAVRGEYDIAILVSADTDLRPAVNAVYDQNGPSRPWIELAGWRGPRRQRPIAATAARRVGELWIDQADYDASRDSTDYSVGK